MFFAVHRFTVVYCPAYPRTWLEGNSNAAERRLADLIDATGTGLDPRRATVLEVRVVLSGLPAPAPDFDEDECYINYGILRETVVSKPPIALPFQRGSFLSKIFTADSTAQVDRVYNVSLARLRKKPSIV